MKRTLSVATILSMLLSCSKDKVDEPGPILPITVARTESICYETQPLIRRVTGLTGRISFSREQNLYFISHGVSGTYDTVWIGYVCNLPDQYKVLDKQVIFGGEYRKGPDKLSIVGGEESYYLFLTEVK